MKRKILLITIFLLLIIVIMKKEFKDCKTEEVIVYAKIIDYENIDDKHYSITVKTNDNYYLKIKGMRYYFLFKNYINRSVRIKMIKNTFDHFDDLYSFYYIELI